MPRPAPVAFDSALQEVRVGAVSDAETAAFQAVRPRLLGIAYRVLGNAAEAEDVVQDAWIRWQGTERSIVVDAAAFLATTAARLAINVARSARARHEAHCPPRRPDPADLGADPAASAERRDALERALRALSERLSPAEGAAYVLREGFGYRFRQISEALGLSEPNARQLVTRARGRLSGPPRRRVGAAEQTRLVETVLGAAETGDLGALERLLAAGVGRAARPGEASVPLGAAA
jgi:RNA polymerase sigma-70 factor (ECF subfamily)